MSRLCFYELDEVGLSYRKANEDVKKNIINIMIIYARSDYLINLMGYVDFIRK
jgi:hypothetical protein